MRYFPLTLGIPRRREEEKAATWPPGRTGDKEARRESLSAQPAPMDEVPAEQELQGLMAGGRGARPLLILGEPGAGKTRLMEHWHETWLRALAGPRLGLAVPVLVRPREVKPETLRQDDPDVIADNLWSAGQAARTAAVNGMRAAELCRLPGRLFTPVWLLDGLDELPVYAGEDWLWDRFGALPGTVVLTCRTAIHQQIAAELAGHVGQPRYILGLKPGQEQQDYLADELESRGRDRAAAPGLVARMNANAALRPLAASPLLLGLVAEMGAPGEPELSGNRATFYQRAMAKLWSRKLKECDRLLNLRSERDAALAAIAAAARLDTLLIPYRALDASRVGRDVREALRLSGLLKFDDNREQVEFPHLCFQEFHLASSLMARPLGDVLEAYWADPRYEETLALRLALGETGRAEGQAAVEQALLDFTAWHRAQHAKNPSHLWGRGRSPLRVALRLAARGGLALKDPLLGAGGAPALLRLAIAADHGVAGAALDVLTKDDCATVREEAAGNPSTPADTLAGLVERRDGDEHVRHAVAGNVSTPAATLRKLACEPNAEVRKMVAYNPSTEPEILSRLATDREESVRAAVGARDPALGAEIAFTQVKDKAFAERVRRALEYRAAISAESLAAAADDTDELVRMAVAGNVATPPDTLAKLAENGDEGILRAVAGNPATPRENLARLAARPDKYLRQVVARNQSTPPDALASLVADPDDEVRRQIATNPATPVPILERLLGDDNDAVCRRAASNPSLPSGTLARLVEDAENYRPLLAMITTNPSTPPEALARLAKDGDVDIRWPVADHPSTPAAALATLATDTDRDVRQAAARNASALLEDLWAAPSPLVAAAPAIRRY